jgi:hypothetical protein
MSAFGGRDMLALNRWAGFTLKRHSTGRMISRVRISTCSNSRFHHSITESPRLVAARNIRPQKAAGAVRIKKPDVSGAAISYNRQMSSPTGRPPMRLVGCFLMCLVPILANAAQTDAGAPSDPQAYCVNSSADFYSYTGEPCKSGYQLGSGNCRKTDGRLFAVPREQCVAMAGTVELPFEGGRIPPSNGNGGIPRLAPPPTR